MQGYWAVSYVMDGCLRFSQHVCQDRQLCPAFCTERTGIIETKLLQALAWPYAER